MSDKTKHQNAKFFIFLKHQLLLLQANNQYELPSYNVSKETKILPIGFHNQTECFVISIESELHLDSSHTWQTLRFALENLESPWQNVLSRAYQIMLWDLNHQFCGRCGKETLSLTGKIEKYCENCHLSFFPRISPAIIVLIKKDDQILMARKKEFAKGIYGLIAGFSEPGETLEETVHREVYEEVGLRVKNICYTGSQPWPFPDSLMLSFTADYESGEISLNDGELEEANWYHIDNLPGRPSSSISIAYRMIENYIAAIKK